MSIIQRDATGWKIKTRFLTFHPISYGVGSLARLSIGRDPDGARLMFHYFPKCDKPDTYHDHPWPFVTLLLWGHYTDISINKDGEVVDECHTGALRFRKASHRHKTWVRKPTFTVVLRSAAVREWCEGDVNDWKCEGNIRDFNETLGMRH